jgi:hypothetical protein
MIRDDVAVAAGDDPRAVFGDVVLVGDEQHGNAAFQIQPLENAHDLDAGAGVEVAGGLVGEVAELDYLVRSSLRNADA